jgi:hypothetical protein
MWEKNIEANIAINQYRNQVLFVILQKNNISSKRTNKATS